MLSPECVYDPRLLIAAKADVNIQTNVSHIEVVCVYEHIRIYTIKTLVGLVSFIFSSLSNFFHIIMVEGEYTDHRSLSTILKTSLVYNIVHTFWLICFLSSVL